MTDDTFRLVVVGLLAVIAAMLLSIGRQLESLWNLSFEYLYDHKGFRRK